MVKVWASLPIEYIKLLSKKEYIYVNINKKIPSWYKDKEPELWVLEANEERIESLIRLGGEPYEAEHYIEGMLLITEDIINYYEKHHKCICECCKGKIVSGQIVRYFDYFGQGRNAGFYCSNCDKKFTKPNFNIYEMDWSILED